MRAPGWTLMVRPTSRPSRRRNSLSTFGPAIHRCPMISSCSSAWSSVAASGRTVPPTFWLRLDDVSALARTVNVWRLPAWCVHVADTSRSRDGRGTIALRVPAGVAAKTIDCRSCSRRSTVRRNDVFLPSRIGPPNTPS